MKHWVLVEEEHAILVGLSTITTDHAATRMAGTNGDARISTINVETNETNGTAAAAAAAAAADFEQTMSTIGYGAFNVLLLLAALPVAWAGLCDTTTTAFILTSAECDLELTFFRKGVLLAFPFIGMTLTSFVWDYVTPRVGARNLFVLGLFADSLLNILSSAVDSYYVLLLVKFLSGVLVGGPFSMVTTYLSEFHAARYKPSFARWAGLLLNAGIIVPAAAAFVVLPLPLAIDVFDRRYDAWRIYLLVCSAVQVVGLLTACTLPQTPKYLVEIGRPEQALELLKRMYCLNTRKPADTFPVKVALPQQPVPRAVSENIRLTSYNAKLLFSSAYLRPVFFLNFLQFASMLGFNTMRLWVPHLFMILSNFDGENWKEDRSPTMSEMLDRRSALPAKDYSDCPDFDQLCMMWIINGPVYQKSTMIACAAVASSFLAGVLVTSELRKRVAFLAGFLLATLSSFAMNWAQSRPYMLTLAVAVILMTRITGNVVTSANVDLIPVPLRTTSVSVLTFVGNIGAILGNFIFSAFLDIHCLVAFMGLGCLFFACFCLSFYRPESPNAPTTTFAQPEA